jgi:hypothetical protein
MEISVIGRQALLYGHILAFALAMATILKEDVRLVGAKHIDAPSLLASARLVKWLLLALWITGVPMVLMDIEGDLSLLLDRPKLLAKLIVVGVLTLNGILLHLVAFPMITSRRDNPNKVATIAAIFGAVSTASWLFAFLVGGARLVGPYLSLSEFIASYALVLALALAFAILFVRKRLVLLLRSSAKPDLSTSRRSSLSGALLEAEIAALALRDIRQRLRTKHLPPGPVYRRTSLVSSVDDAEMTGPHHTRQVSRRAVRRSL